MQQLLNLSRNPGGSEKLKENLGLKGFSGEIKEIWEVARMG